MDKQKKMMEFFHMTQEKRVKTDPFKLDKGKH